VVNKRRRASSNKDKIGSIIWNNCDGKNTVKDILEIMKKEYPKEEDIDQRLFLFLLQMQSLGYINLFTVERLP
jgi:hypothetical protein